MRPGRPQPADKGTLMLTWAGPEVTLDVMERYYSPLRQNPNPTLIYAPSVGDLPAWFQTDINIAHDFTPAGVPVRVFLNVSNLFDAKPGIFQVPAYTGSPGMNYPVVPYEDIIGRSFTLGLRLQPGLTQNSHRGDARPAVPVTNKTISGGRSCTATNISGRFWPAR